MARQGYKKYMKNEPPKDCSLLKVFIFSFFGMLLFFTFLIKSFSPSVDVSIGDYKQETEIENINEIKKNVDNRLSMIQEEDQGKSFTEIMDRAEEKQKQDEKKKELKPLSDKNKNIFEITSEVDVVEPDKIPVSESVYKVFIGSYTSAEQAKVAKDIITESGIELTPIVKCIGTNNYTLQVGIFKNRNSAETLLYTIQKSHLPGRIVQDY